VRWSYDQCVEYLSRVAELVERFGATLNVPDGADLQLLEDQDGTLSFEIIGHLPNGPRGAMSEVTIREAFRRASPDLFERYRYEYELIDTARDFRRAFHLHFPDWFGARFLVVVHEHCERPIGRIDCEHYAGLPIPDAYTGVTTLIDAWTADPPNCRALVCLE
jgi:hypothetical protein